MESINFLDATTPETRELFQEAMNIIDAFERMASKDVDFLIQIANSEELKIALARDALIEDGTIGDSQSILPALDPTESLMRLSEIIEQLENEAPAASAFFLAHFQRLYGIESRE